MYDQPIERHLQEAMATPPGPRNLEKVRASSVAPSDQGTEAESHKVDFTFPALHCATVTAHCLSSKGYGTNRPQLQSAQQKRRPCLMTLAEAVPNHTWLHH